MQQYIEAIQLQKRNVHDRRTKLKHEAKKRQDKTSNAAKTEV